MTGTAGALQSRIAKLEHGTWVAPPDSPIWELDTDWLGDYFEVLARVNVCSASALARMEAEVAEHEVAGRATDAEVLRRHLGWRRWERSVLVRLAPELAATFDVERAGGVVGDADVYGEIALSPSESIL